MRWDSSRRIAATVAASDMVMVLIPDNGQSSVNSPNCRTPAGFPRGGRIRPSAVGPVRLSGFGAKPESRTGPTAEGRMRPPLGNPAGVRQLGLFTEDCPLSGIRTMTISDAATVAAILRELSQRMELDGGNPYRARAYAKAADNLALS